MMLDILLGVPLLIFTLLGLRDGIVRKLVASIVFIGGLFLGQMYMHNVGSFMVENEWVGPANASMYGFLIIFMGLTIAQGLLYRILTGGYKIGGFADRIGGVAFGFIEGALFLSSILFILALSGTPGRETSHDSKFYRPIVNIAPQILDFTSSLGPDAMQRLKEISTSGTDDKKAVKTPRQHTIDSTAAAETKKQNQLLNRARGSLRKLKE
jgi:uncharacterized membrane protein required for colicin V production